MSAISKFISKENQMRVLFGQQLLSIPTTFEECKPYFVNVTNMLSPEILHRDGEASHTEVVSQMKELKAVWSDLESISGRKVSEEESWQF